MRLSVSRKLIGMVGVLLIMMTAGTIMSYLFLKYTISSFNHFEESDVALIKSAMRAQTNYGLSVRAFKNYLIRKDKKYIDEFNAASKAMKDDLNTYNSLSGTDEERTAVKVALEKTKAFEETFYAMVKEREQNNDITNIDKLYGRPAAPVYEAILKLDKMGENIYKEEREKLHRRFDNMILFLAFSMVAAAVIALIMSSLITRNILKSIHLVREATDQVSSGDLTRDVLITSHDELGDMSRQFNKMMRNLKDIVGNISSASNNLINRVDVMSKSTESLNNGVREQAQQTDQAVSAMTEMSQTVIDIAKNAASASDASNETRDIATQGSDVVEKTVEIMIRINSTVSEAVETIEALRTSSEEIGNIVNTINDIADQTNLLALNAAIEAARAGEQGRGFAVVADEVRRLAERTSHATKEIADMIGRIQNDTNRSVKSMHNGKNEVEEGVRMAQDAREALFKIVQAASTATDMIQMIATASEEQSSTAEHITLNMEGIANVTSRTNTTSEEINISSKEILKIASDLRSSVSWFKT